MTAHAILLAMLLAAPGVPMTATAPTAFRCSKIVFTAARGERDVVLVGSTLADTVRAGAGSVQFAVGPGEDRDAVGRAVHGRLVAVEALDGHTRALLPAGVARVLLVPWGYSADCTTVAWNDTARWAPAGLRGLFLGRLRDRAQWAGDVPTIDVTAPYRLPYTGRPRSARDAEPALTPDELLALYDAIRSVEDDAGARAAARAWAREHPDLMVRRPATTVLLMLREPGEAPRITSAPSPLPGTWRLDASLDGAAPRTGWVRTWERTSHVDFVQPTPAERAADPLAPPRVIAYYLFSAADTALAALPVAAQPHRVQRGGYVRVAVPDERAPLDAGPWRGAFELDVLAHAFAPDTAIAAFVRDARAEERARYRSRLPWPTPATFTRDADGALRVEQRITLTDGRTLEIRGVRVSTDAVRDAAPAR